MVGTTTVKLPNEEPVMNKHTAIYGHTRANENIRQKLDICNLNERISEY